MLLGREIPRAKDSSSLRENPDNFFRADGRSGLVCMTATVQKQRLYKVIESQQLAKSYCASGGNMNTGDYWGLLCIHW